jgi:hypothetical protein
MASIQVYPYLSPRLIEVLAPDTEISIQELVDLCRDWEDEDDNMSFEYLIDAAGKESLGGGVSVGITASLNNAQLMFSARTTKIDDGVGRTCDANDIYGRQLYVDDATFVTSGVERGDLIYNTATGAYATVLEVIDENTINHFNLEGGSSSEWTIGDTYIVYDTEQCSISGGNLVAKDDLGADISSTLYSFGTQIIQSSSSSATLQELATIQHAAFNEGVTIDVTDITGNAQGGITFPVGTLKQPSNNLTDTGTILSNEGLNKIFIIGNLTLSNEHAWNRNEFVGESVNKTVLTINPEASVLNCEFSEATITGTLDGNSVIKNCILGTVNYVEGEIRYSKFASGSTITLGTGTIASFEHCTSGQPGVTTPVVDCNATGIISLRDYHGGVKFINYTGSGEHSIDMSSGQCILDSATVTGGTWVVRGIGKLIDENGNPIDSDLDVNGRPIPTIWNGTVTILNELLTAGAVSGTGGGSSPWTEAEKDKIIADTEIVKDQSKISALHAVNQLNSK